MIIKKYVIWLIVFFLAKHSATQWTIDIANPTNYSLEYVDIVDSSTAWAIGHYAFNQDSSILLIKRDFGNWFQHYIPIANNNDFTCIAALDDNKAWIGTADGKVFYTSYDSNKTVLQIDIGGQAFINDIKFSRINRNYGYVYSDPPAGPGTPFKIFKTSNAGANWIELSPVFGGSYVGAFASMCVTDSDHVWIGLNCQSSNCQVPKVAFTTNGGLTWQTSSIPNGSNDVSAVVFKYDNSYGIAAPWDQVPTYLFKSINGGGSWSFLYNTQLQTLINAMSWADSTNTWYFCSNDVYDQIKKSTNDGLTWDAMVIPNGTLQIQSIDVMRQGNKVYGYAVAFGGKNITIS